MTYEKLSDIIVLEKFEVYSTKKANRAFVLAETQVKKGHYSVKNLRLTSKFELDLSFMTLYISIKFERKC